MTTSDWIEAGDRIWLRRYDPLDVNVTVIDGKRGRVVVDTRGSRRQGLEVRAHLAELGDHPIVAVVNTHHHFDHVYGNEVFVDTPIVGHIRAAQILVEEGEARRAELYDWVPEWAHEELAETKITPPTTLVDAPTELDLGERRLRLSHVGRGHTDNDLVIEVVDGDVVVAGDLIEQSAPPSMGDAFPLEWPGTVGALLDLRARTFLPGHGLPMSADEVATQQQELQALADLLGRHMRGEVGVDEVLAASPFPGGHTQDALRRLSG